tara:strand:- start:26 stop:418 length:393 start_codon:yes stop_codon:yes gene_type:complete
MNFFKLVTIVAFTAGFAHSIHAADLGGNLSLNTDVKATYMVDAETTVATINPEFSWSGIESLQLSAGTTFNLWENVGVNSDITDELDHLPVLEFGADYSILSNLDISAGFNYDLEAKERGDIKLEAVFSF